MYSFVFLTSITAIILVIFSIYATKFYYYSTMEGVLNNEIRYSTNLYSSYMADYELDEVIAEDKNQFYRQTDCQVQILDNNQIVVFDSIASPNLGKKIETSDVVIQTDDPMALPAVMNLSKKTMKVVKENFGLVIGINTLGLVFSAAGVLPVFWGAVLHNSSTIFVVSNSIRLLFSKIENKR